MAPKPKRKREASPAKAEAEVDAKSSVADEQRVKYQQMTVAQLKALLQEQGKRTS
jgi:hypothetical protein